jgi:hypothetical protein
MLKLLAILASIVALASLIGVSASQNVPPNTPKKGIVESDSISKRKPPAEGQREDQNSQKVPSVVVQVESPSVESNRPDSHEDEAAQKLAWFTFWLMIFTAWLVVVGFLQVILLRRHAGHLENLASAADASSKATTEIQTAIQKQAELMGKTLVLQFRPKVIIRVVQVKTSNIAPLMEQATGTVEIALVNIGQTHAKVFTAQFEAIAVDFGVSIGNTQVFENAKNFAFDLAGGAFENITLPLSGRVNEAIRWADDRLAGKVLGDARKGIYLVGSLAYVDDVGIKRQGGCFRNYDPSIKSFVPSKNSDREYVD